MGLIGLIFGLPFAPIRGVIRLAELIQEQVEYETRHPAAVRRQLEALEEARREGLISEEEEALETERILSQMIEEPGAPV
ncbi:gas vesicle protein GvpG [Streptosporangium sp. NPDC000396]|uniref:gas vesicle protein GvpG n=1 Tax=Streptosporangium sp. NPDC000396 TaxID=3366185 RepID=UPI0036CB0CFB